MRRSPVHIPALLAVLALPGCKSRQTERREHRPFQTCSRDSRCIKPQICLLRPPLTSGTCVHACVTDTDCGAGLRCTGRFHQTHATGPRRRYCRRAQVDVGGDCSRVTDGCKPGLQCKHGQVCVRSCQSDGDCTPSQRCVPIPDRRTFGHPAPTLYKACVTAEGKAGASCTPGQQPLCARNHDCQRNRCVRLCSKEAPCGEGQVCDGVRAAAARPGGAEPPRAYCRRAAPLGERCGRHWSRDVGCAAGLRCYKGRCRKPCETDADCHTGKRRKLRCRVRRDRRASFKVCL